MGWRGQSNCFGVVHSLLDIYDVAYMDSRLSQVRLRKGKGIRNVAVKQGLGEVWKRNSGKTRKTQKETERVITTIEQACRAFCRGESDGRRQLVALVKARMETLY